MNMPNTPKPGRARATRDTSTPPLSIAQWAADTAPARRADLRRFLDDHGLTPAELARQLGLRTPNLLYNFLNEYSNSLSQSVLDLIGRRYPAFRLLLEPGAADAAATCPVIAVAALGRRQPAFRLDRPLMVVSPPVALPYPPADLFGVLVEDASAARFYPAGSILVCAGPGLVTTTPIPRPRVVVSRRVGKAVEVSVREQRTRNEAVWFWSGSEDPDHQTPLTKVDVTIEGIVLATWQPEPINAPT